MLLETSTASVSRRLVSSSNCFTTSRSLRPQTFQSTWRSSSPMTYSRCCKNSTDCPKYGLRCIPDKKPSTICRARRSKRPMRLIASGCKNLLESGIAGQGVFFGGGDTENPFDHAVDGHAFAFGREIQHDAMAEHRRGERGDVV